VSYLSNIAAQIRAEVDSEIVPADSDQLFLIYALVLLTKGLEANEEDIHNAWCAWMAGRNPDHESLIPFDQLDEATKAMDTPFVAAIHKVAATSPK
jgi:hypothetical protein